MKTGQRYAVWALLTFIYRSPCSSFRRSNTQGFNYMCQNVSTNISIKKFSTFSENVSKVLEKSSTPLALGGRRGRWCGSRLASHGSGANQLCTSDSGGTSKSCSCGLRPCTTTRELAAPRLAGRQAAVTRPPTVAAACRKVEEDRLEFVVVGLCRLFLSQQWVIGRYIDCMSVLIQVMLPHVSDLCRSVMTYSV